MSNGRHALPRQRSGSVARLLPALVPVHRTSSSGRHTGHTARPASPLSAGPAAPPRRRGGSHRATGRAVTPVAPLATPAQAGGGTPWLRTVAFSGVTGVAALTVGLTAIPGSGTAGTFDAGHAPQATASVTVMEPAGRAGSGGTALNRPAPADHTAAPEPLAPAVSGSPLPEPAAAPTARPATSGPTSGPAPSGEPEAPSGQPTPAEPSPTETPGLLDTVGGVVGVVLEPPIGG